MNIEEQEEEQTGRLNVEKVQRIMKKHGAEVSQDEALFILRFAQKFANVALAKSAESLSQRGIQPIS